MLSWDEERPLDVVVDLIKLPFIYLESLQLNSLFSSLRPYSVAVVWIQSALYDSGLELH